MRQDQYAKLAHSAGTGSHAREVFEHLGDHRDGRHAGAFALNRVVDTPRRTRPSGTEANDCRVDGAHETRHLLAFFFGRADTRAGVEQHHVAYTPALRRGEPDHFREFYEGAPGPIDTQAQDAAGERWERW